MQIKICNKCKKEKSVDGFYRDRSTKDGFCYYCKTCIDIKQKNYSQTEKGKQVKLQGMKKYRESKKGKATRKRSRELYKQSGKAKIVYRKSNLKCKFNITIKQYDEMFEKQNGNCAICHKPEINTRRGIIRRLSIDHDHKTGKIRELLCFKCNTNLGILEDKDFVKKAEKYLRNHQE